MSSRRSTPWHWFTEEEDGSSATIRGRIDITDAVDPVFRSAVTSNRKWKRVKSFLRRDRSSPLRSQEALPFIHSVLHEPLFQFLILGALLFLFFQWAGGGSGAGSNRIVITPGQIDHLAVGFAGTWQREPTADELKGLIDDYVKEEMATREAVAAGLDRDDTIIRRRLRQKVEFLSEEASSAAAPTDAELQDWMTKHPASFRSQPQLGFRQVYINPTRHGSALADAATLLTQLRAAGPHASIDRLGDPTMLPNEPKLAPISETTRTFGSDFTDQVLRLETGKWVGPVESSFGLHLVYVDRKVDASQPQLPEVRPRVEREYMSERRKRDLESFYDKLLKKYTVKIEHREATAATAASAAGGVSK